MSLETDLVALLRTVCPRVSPDVATLNTPLPLITYQHIGGSPLRYLDGTASDQRHAIIQVNVWDKTRANCLGLIRQVEDVLSTADTINAQPDGEVFGQAAEDIKLYGISQDFSIHAAR